MTWENARNLIVAKMQVGFELTDTRKVLQVPPYSCTRFKLGGGRGFKIKIGTGENTYLDVPLSMLEQVFNAAVNNGNVYDNQVFMKCYPKITTKGCYVNAIGQIFTHAGVAKLVDNSKRKYKLN